MVNNKIQKMLENKSTDELIAEIYGITYHPDYCHEWCKNDKCNKEHVEYKN